MPKAKQRPSVATIVSKSALEQVGANLQELPEKPKDAWSLREAVALLQDAITIALNRGYSYDEIVEVLADNEINITASSLKRYLATARRDREDAAGTKRQPRKPRTPKALSVKQPAAKETSSPPPATAKAAPPEPEPLPPARTALKPAAKAKAGALTSSSTGSSTGMRRRRSSALK